MSSKICDISFHAVVVLMHVQLDNFNWTCANVLIGAGDPYSTAGAQAFQLAALANKIDVCIKAEYVSGSGDMEGAIKDILDKKCCRVTVVFGQTQDLTSLFLEAHKQHYNGEWVVGDELLVNSDGIVKDLKRQLPEPSVHELLRGMLEEDRACVAFGIQAQPPNSGVLPITH